MREMEKLLKALANRRRLAILKFLKKNRQASVGDISESIDLSFKATSKHLTILTALDILKKDQKSSNMFYRIAKKQKQSVEYILSLL